MFRRGQITVWSDKYRMISTGYPNIPIKEIWEFSALVARKILKDDSEKLVSDLTDSQLMDYVSAFLSQSDHNLPEHQIVSLLKSRYIELSELICRYRINSADFGDEYPNESDVFHFVKNINHLCSGQVWNELINQAICVFLYETFGNAITTEEIQTKSTIIACMHGDALRHLQRLGLM